MDYDIAHYKSYWEKKKNNQKEEMNNLKHRLLTSAKKCALFLKKHYHVQKVYLFGSLINKKKIHSKSDIDLAVVGLDDKYYFKALNALYGLIPDGTDVDLITLESVDGNFREYIEKNGLLISGSD